MSCKDFWEKEMAGRLEGPSRVAPGQVDGGQRCDHAGCPALVNLATNACVRGHVQGGTGMRPYPAEVDALFCAVEELQAQGRLAADDPAWQRLQEFRRQAETTAPGARETQETLGDLLDLIEQEELALGDDPAAQDLHDDPRVRAGRAAYYEDVQAELGGRPCIQPGCGQRVNPVTAKCGRGHVQFYADREGWDDAPTAGGGIRTEVDFMRFQMLTTGVDDDQVRHNDRQAISTYLRQCLGDAEADPLALSRAKELVDLLRQRVPNPERNIPRHLRRLMARVDAQGQAAGVASAAEAPAVQYVRELLAEDGLLQADGSVVLGDAERRRQFWTDMLSAPNLVDRAGLQGFAEYDYSKDAAGNTELKVWIIHERGPGLTTNQRRWLAYEGHLPPQDHWSAAEIADRVTTIQQQVQAQVDALRAGTIVPLPVVERNVESDLGYAPVCRLAAGLAPGDSPVLLHETEGGYSVLLANVNDQPVGVAFVEDGLIIDLAGYAHAGVAADFGGGVVAIGVQDSENEDAEPSVGVWADRTQKKATHEITLADASEGLRRQQEEGVASATPPWGRADRLAPRWVQPVPGASVGDPPAVVARYEQRVAAVTIGPTGMAFDIQGYGTAAARAGGEGGIVYLDLANQAEGPVLLVRSKINQQDATHRIPLAGARIPPPRTRRRR